MRVKDEMHATRVANGYSVRVGGGSVQAFADEWPCFVAVRPIIFAFDDAGDLIGIEPEGADAGMDGDGVSRLAQLARNHGARVLYLPVPMPWCDSMGRIELTIAADQALACSGPSSADAAVAVLIEHPAIRSQLDRIAPDAIRDTLREYGGWDDAELADDARNRARIVWLACCAIREGDDD